MKRIPARESGRRKSTSGKDLNIHTSQMLLKTPRPIFSYHKQFYQIANYSADLSRHSAHLSYVPRPTGSITFFQNSEERKIKSAHSALQNILIRKPPFLKRSRMMKDQIADFSGSRYTSVLINPGFEASHQENHSIQLTGSANYQPIPFIAGIKPKGSRGEKRKGWQS